MGEMSILDGSTGNTTQERTGSHIPRRVIPLARSFRTSAPVGTHKRLDPKDPGSYHENDDMSTVSGLRKQDVQVVSEHRDRNRGSFGNWQLGVHPPGGPNDRFRQRHDIIFYRCPEYL